MENFTPLSSAFGGVLIGISATMMLFLHGRVAGISGIVGGVIDSGTHRLERRWRLAFLVGLIGAGLPLLFLLPDRFVAGIERSHLALIAAGVLVGLGTRLGSGCTSGHGVCGISRLSPRSMVATGTFMASGALTVWLVNLLAGGSL